MAHDETSFIDEVAVDMIARGERLDDISIRNAMVRRICQLELLLSDQDAIDAIAKRVYDSMLPHDTSDIEIDVDGLFHT